MEKWLAITMIVVFGSLALGGAVEHYSTKQCRIEAIKVGVDANLIDKACGVK